MVKYDWKTQKGKDYSNLPLKTLVVFEEEQYYVSTKYDGNQVFIVKEGMSVRFFTSDWKEFRLPSIARSIATSLYDFVIVAEMNYGGPGKQGERTTVQGKITTERANFKNLKPCSLDESKVQLMAFDVIEFDDKRTINNYHTKQRLVRLEAFVLNIPEIDIVKYKLMTGKEAALYTKQLVKQGWEGTMLSMPDEYYHMSKRVNHVIKLKYRPTADLLCIGTEVGEGKYSECIGSLVLTDIEGRIVKVGSGLGDGDRLKDPKVFIGSIIEISYEQLMDTYQQPVYIGIRADKKESD